MKNRIFKEAIKSTLPVLAGYAVLGMGFGIIMVKSNFGAIPAILMSIFIYAGSMQYAAVGLFLSGASLLTVFFTTLAVNLRHLFYGFSMIDNYKDTGKIKPYLIFSLTDETYSLVCGEKKESGYYTGVSALNHIYWILGTVIGAVLGNVITFNTKGIDFALTALFITIFTDQWMTQKNHRFALFGIGASLVSLVIFGKESFLIPSMAIILILLFISYKGEKCDEK